MWRILLVEDSKDVQDLILKTLEGRSQVSCVAYAQDALKAIDRETFDLVLLDVTLPDGDGFHLCAQFRNHDKTRDVPVIFLTAKAESADKVMGFSLGADDYIVKPFDRAEFKARIEAKLSRIQSKKTAEDSVRKGALRISVSSQAAFLAENGGEKNLGLTPLEFKLLYYLVRNEGRLATREQLLSSAWGNDVYVYDRTVDKHISSLRKKLGSMSHWVHTIPQVGYKFSMNGD